MTVPIQLIVGLGNPGPEYEQTRHNAGAWFVKQLALKENVQLRPETKFKGQCAPLTLNGNKCFLFIPSTFMNVSGQAVHAIANFYKVPPLAILIAHDDLDLPPGISRIKFDGGHGGHNGLRDIMDHLNTNSFYRIRLGIGHPADSKQVVDYVLKHPSKSDKNLIDIAITETIEILPDLISGEIQKAMKTLHTKTI